MMISTKGRYALRVMIDIAEHRHDGYIPLKEIAARQEISEKYLEAIVKSLVKERYLTGLRGKSGGSRRALNFVVDGFRSFSCGAHMGIAFRHVGSPFVSA